MATWTFEPGHTAAEFCVRHMMVTWVRGQFKNVQGTLEFDPASQTLSSLKATIRARELWTGEPQRDQHLRSGDFLDVDHHPLITFQTSEIDRVGGDDYQMKDPLTIRGVTRTVAVDLHYQGKWQTPYYDARVTRVGFTGQARLNRHDFGVSWNSTMHDEGLVVGNEVLLTIDVEGILETQLQAILGQGGQR